MAYDVTKLARLSALKAVGTKISNDYAKEAVLNGIVVSGENAANVTVTGTTTDTTKILSASLPTGATYNIAPVFTDEIIEDTSITLVDMLGADALAELTGVEQDGTTIYTFTVNAVEITCTQNSTLDEIMNSVSNSDAGVTLSYSKLTGEFVFQTKETGSNQDIEIEGGLADKLFGKKTDPENLMFQESKIDSQSWLLDEDGERLTFTTTDGITFGLQYNSDDGKFYRYDESGDLIDGETTLDWDENGNPIFNKVVKDITEIDDIDGMSGSDFLANVLETQAGRKGYTAGKDAELEVEVNGTKLHLTRTSNTVDLDGMSVTLKNTFDAYETDEDGNTTLNPDKVVTITSTSGQAEGSLKSGSASGRTISLYSSTDATGSAVFSFDLPVELATDLTKTQVVSNFAFSTDTYPGATDPSLEGRAVIVLAVSGDDGSTTYSFMDLQSLVDTYTAKTDGKDPSTTVTIADKTIDVAVNVSADAGNQLQAKEDGLYVSISDSTDISGKADKATTLAGYGITDAYTKAEFDEKAAVTYVPAGSVAFADLPTADATSVGKVYNITDSFTTDENFVEEANVNYPAGTNVAIVATDDGYAYDVLSGAVDLSSYAKVSDVPTVEASETAGAISVDGTDVQIVDIATDDEFAEMLDELFPVNA